jgi:hypothetical protein
MLTGYVNEYHSNWDVLLPYVMMAYRSAEHKTTGYTPNRATLIAVNDRWHTKPWNDLGH